MKIRTRRCRRRNNPTQQGQRQRGNHMEEPAEVKENIAAVEVNSPNHGGTSHASDDNASAAAAAAAAVAAVIIQANRAMEEANQRNNANYHAATDDEDSGTESDKNGGAITDDEDPEAAKERYKVEAARTMRDIIHTRDVLFNLTRRVDQLLEFCKILQAKQKQQQELSKQEQQPPNEGFGKSSQ